MLNITTSDIISLRQKSMELALQISNNNTANTDTAKILQDAETIYNWITKDKEAAQP